jgi:uncharacterized membrane protein
MTDEPQNFNKETNEPVWSFRGYHLRPSEFTTAMVHYYRAEIQRSNTWRTRLDNTTNWAVVTTSAAITFALSSPSNNHGVLILTSLLVLIFLWIEARRYRYYELWAYRTRLMETEFFAAMVAPPFSPSPEWAENLAKTLLSPEFPISTWEAIGRRLRRNYIWIFILLTMVWGLKVYLHPTPVTTWAEFVQRAAVGPIPGSTALILGVIFNVALILLAIFTAGLKQSSGEVLPKFEGFPGAEMLRRMLATHPEKEETSAGRKPGTKLRKTILAMIVTEMPEAVSEKIVKDMKRSGTMLSGQGIYSHQDKPVLLVALTITEVAHLKAIVREQDPQAFVVVIPTQEILGGNFQPIQEKE